VNYLVQPLLYAGSSFEDIWVALIRARAQLDIPIEIVPAIRAEPRDLWSGLDEPREFAQNQAMQIALLAGKLQSGDRVLLPDFFAPGIDLLQYLREREQLDVRLGALLLGASFVPGDLYGWPWLHLFEEAWLEVLDRVYCPSEWMAQAIPAGHRNKAIVIPWEVHLSHLPKDVPREFDVVFPHRWALDKGVEDFVEIVRALPEVSFVVTGFGTSAETPDSLRAFYTELRHADNVVFRERESAQAHLLTLSSARVVLSTARQEGFGYAVMKAVQCGCLPFLPNRCCYPEFFPPTYLYDSVADAIRCLPTFLSAPPPPPPLVEGSFAAVLTSFFGSD
jgi:glycosyltransferase involved in cell wall biosynthesis